MCYRRQDSDSRITRSRRGAASLEFALSLPILLTLFAVILSTGYLGLGRIGLAVENRNKAWKQRDQARLSRPLFFTETEQPILAEGSKSVKILPFSRVTRLTVHSRHAVLGGSWDHHELAPCDEPFKTVEQMAISQGVGDVAWLTDTVSSIGNLGSALLGNLQSLGSQGASAMNAIDQAKAKVQQAQQQNQQQITATKAKIQQLQQNLDQVNQDLASLQQQRQNAEKIQDAQKRKQELNRIDQQITSDNQKVQQLNNQLQQQQDHLNRLNAVQSAGGLVP
jgi:hypothetical protein